MPGSASTAGVGRTGPAIHVKFQAYQEGSGKLGRSEACRVTSGK